VSAFLADTHVFLWSLMAPEKLTSAWLEVLNSDATVFLSIASIWEISIKAGLGKLEAPARLGSEALVCGYDLLAITPEHAEAVRALPHHHGDPFDRMLIAQAQRERLRILTADRRFASYDVHVI
jgi:PIN domain nuclease of toxin-antitoxin system